MRQRFAKGLGGTLRHEPIEMRDGVAPTSATVTIKTSLGLEMPEPVKDAPATIDPDTGELSFVLTAKNTPDPTSLGYYLSPQIDGYEKDPTTFGYLYRAVWTYVIGGVTYVTDQTFEVNARLLKPTIRMEDVEPELPDDWEDLLEAADVMADRAIDKAWNDVLDDLLDRGFQPDRIMTPERLERVHRERVVWNVLRSCGPDWKQAANDARDLYQTDFNAFVASPGWYDANMDTIGSDAETKVTTIVLGR